MEKEDLNNTKVVLWLTGGLVNGKPIPGITYHCKIETEDFEGEKRSIYMNYDFDEEILDELDTKDIIRRGNTKVLKEILDKMEESLEDLLKDTE